MAQPTEHDKLANQDPWNPNTSTVEESGGDRPGTIELLGAHPSTHYGRNQGIDFDLVRINFAEVNALSSSRKASSATALSPKVEQKETSLDPGDLVLKRVVVGILQAFVNDENNAEAPTIVFSPDDSSRPTTHPLPSDAQTGQDQFQESNTRNLGGQTKLTKLLSQASILLATIHPEDAGRVLKTINPLNEHSRWPLAPISELILFMCRILKAGRIILVKGETEFDYLNQLLQLWFDKHAGDAMGFLEKFCTQHQDSHEVVTSSTHRKAITLLAVTPRGDTKTAQEIISSMGKFDMAPEAVADHPHSLVAGTLYQFEETLVDERAAARGVIHHGQVNSGSRRRPIAQHPLSDPATGISNQFSDPNWNGYTASNVPQRRNGTVPFEGYAKASSALQAIMPGTLFESTSTFSRVPKPKGSGVSGILVKNEEFPVVSGRGTSAAPYIVHHHPKPDEEPQSISTAPVFAQAQSHEQPPSISIAPRYAQIPPTGNHQEHMDPLSQPTPMRYPSRGPTVVGHQDDSGVRMRHQTAPPTMAPANVGSDVVRSRVTRALSVPTRSPHAEVPKTMKIGHSESTFNWWKVQGSTPHLHPSSLLLSEAPRVGDVLYYTAGNAGTSVYMHRGNQGWFDVTNTFFNVGGPENEFLLHPLYPNDPKILTMRDAKDKEPTYVKITGFAQKAKKLVAEMKDMQEQGRLQGL